MTYRVTVEIHIILCTVLLGVGVLGLRQRFFKNKIILLGRNVREKNIVVIACYRVVGNCFAVCVNFHTLCEVKLSVLYGGACRTEGNWTAVKLIDRGVLCYAVNVDILIEYVYGFGFGIVNSGNSVGKLAVCIVNNSVVGELAGLFIEKRIRSNPEQITNLP